MANYLDKTGLEYFWGKIKTALSGKLGVDDTANNTEAIPYGTVDSTSTETVMTATVPGITELKDGTCALIKNGVVTSASGFTLNVNGLGAKPVYTNLAAATRETTIFNVAYTMLFVYDSTRVTNGCWICYRGYDSSSAITFSVSSSSTHSQIPSAKAVYNAIPTSTSDLTNDSGFLTLSTLPIYDGTVVTGS